jgi:hypothetical protein
MNLENVLNNDDNKLIFLKAIMLGITYGSSDKKNYYKENIESEIKKIVDKMNNIDNKINNNLSSQKNILLQKTEQKILFLENQRKSILSLINQLSSNNYGFNYSRINLLKTNLTLLNVEIEKNKLIIKKNKEEDISQNAQKKIKPISKNIKKINTLQSIPQNTLQSIPQNTLQSIPQNTLQSIPQKIHQNKENLVSELEKTLGSLSNMIIN